DDARRHVEGALLAVQELAEQPRTLVPPELVALLLGHLLPDVGAEQGVEVLRQPGAVDRIDLKVPVDALLSVPLLVLALLVQVEQPVAALVVLPGETGVTGHWDVPRVRRDRRGVEVVRTQGGILLRG